MRIYMKDERGDYGEGAREIGRAAGNKLLCSD